MAWPSNHLRMETTIGFSVAITVWKREFLLPHALQSVFRQDHACQEIIVFSDGSSRATRRILEPLGERHPIRYLEVARRRKYWGNHLRRRALEETSGSHVIILGHDCVLYPAYLRAHLANIGSNPNALSVVPIDYWRVDLPDGRQPRADDLMLVGEGEIDLLCIGYPRRLALDLDCFGVDMLPFRRADYLSFDRLRACTAPVYRPGPTQAAHF
ncbi:MAG TPA: glycosyltransferase family A protein [Steroidobacteraceae bacterium]